MKAGAEIMRNAMQSAHVSKKNVVKRPWRKKIPPPIAGFFHEIANATAGISHGRAFGKLESRLPSSAPDRIAKTIQKLTQIRVKMIEISRNFFCDAFVILPANLNCFILRISI